jgi:hypothetical protein
MGLGSLIGGLIGGPLGIIGGGLFDEWRAGEERDDANQFNASQAQANRDFKERMSSATSAAFMLVIYLVSVRSEPN